MASKSFKQRLIEAMEAYRAEHDDRPDYDWMLVDLKRRGSGPLAGYWYAIGQELGIY